MRATLTHKIFWFTLLLPFTLQAATTLRLTLSNPHPYVGEPILATYTLHGDHPIGNRDPFRPTFPGWWSVPMVEANTTDGGRTIRWIYRLSPQRSGTLLLPEQHVSTTYMDPKTYAITRQRHAVSSQTLTIRPLPAGVTIAGDFHLTEHFEHNTTRPDAPATLTLTIEGHGNVDDIPPFDLNRTDALILASKPTRTYVLRGETLHARFQQTFTLVADHTLTLHPLEFTYFHTPTRLTQILRTAPHTLTIHGTRRSTSAVWCPWIYGGIGLLIGILITLLAIALDRYRRRTQNPSAHRSLTTRLHRARDDRARYALLLPYAHEKKVQPLLRQLEKNIFEGGRETIDWKGICWREIVEETTRGGSRQGA